jgi:hypothetical protein
MSHRTLWMGLLALVAWCGYRSISSIGELEADGDQWAPHGSRVRPPPEHSADDDRADAGEADPYALHAAMLTRIAARGA